MSTVQSLTCITRPYVESDFYDGQRKFMRKDFVALISKQPHLWPSTLKKFDRHKTSISDMKNALLSADSQFRLEDTAVITGPSSASDSSDASELCLTVSLTDYHLQTPPTVRVALLRLPIIDSLGCDERTRRVFTSVMLEALQHSNAAIPGMFSSQILDRCSRCFLPGHQPVRITRPDVPRSSHGYLVASAFVPSTLEQSDFAPQYIIVPMNGTLYLNITNSLVNPDATILSVLPPPSAPTIINRNPARAPRSCVDILVDSLKMKAQQMEGYAEFEKDRHRPLQNSEIVSRWRFAVEFRDQHIGKVDTISGLIPTDKAIAEALGYGTTWLLSAQRGTRILRKYGPESLTPVGAIVEEIGTDRHTPRGLVALSKFLRQQELDGIH
ncbi:hypothetical protein FB446DRAFT_761035 [Lentinula raphanica]|nr:hypothetical protein FB446DRAFT_761035 [Lentinula raphanica]